MPKIGIEIRIGAADEGAPIEARQFSSFYTFYIQNYEQQQQRISLENFLKDLRKLNLSPSRQGLDLLVLACAAYAADNSINRYKNSDDGWTRQFHLFVPVSDPGLWQPQHELISEILNFLTGDLWELSFRQSSTTIVVSNKALKPTTRTSLGR